MAQLISGLVDFFFGPLALLWRVFRAPLAFYKRLEDETLASCLGLVFWSRGIAVYIAGKAQPAYSLFATGRRENPAFLSRTLPYSEIPVLSEAREILGFLLSLVFVTPMLLVIHRSWTRAINDLSTIKLILVFGAVSSLISSFVRLPVLNIAAAINDRSDPAFWAKFDAMNVWTIAAMLAGGLACVPFLVNFRRLHAQAALWRIAGGIALWMATTAAATLLVFYVFFAQDLMEFFDTHSMYMH